MFISSSTSNNSTCPGGCALSNCFACYYSYNNLPLPNIAKSCPTSPCSINGKDKNCTKKWGECVRSAYIATYENVSLLSLKSYKYILLQLHDNTSLEIKMTFRVSASLA